MNYTKKIMTRLVLSLLLLPAIDAFGQQPSAIFVNHVSGVASEVPTVTTSKDYARGSTLAFCRGTVAGVSASLIKERGICWSTGHNPTVSDNRSVTPGTTGSFLCRVDGLQPSTVYYMRSYALTTEDAVSYGDEIKVITIPRGTITYTLESDVAGEHRNRLEAAASSAVNYWNNLTSIQGHHLSIHYGSGTPTAEASYGGWMRFGPNASYQRTGTVLHEMGHTIGVGQHEYWTSSSSPLKAGGVWQGERANKVLRFMTNDPTAVMKGDYVHMWPYGINGAHEDTGDEMLYIINSLVTQGLGEDGLPPTSAQGFATPYYAFDYIEGRKYYIRNEDVRAGRDSLFIIEKTDGNMMFRKMTVSEALANDSAAWYLNFDPEKRYYTIRNAATGNYFTYKTVGVNGIATAERTDLTSNEWFHLMPSRKTTVLGEGVVPFEAKSYWIIHPETKLNPPCFVAHTKTATTCGTFSIADASSVQRWFLLSEDELDRFDLPTGTADETLYSPIRIYGSKGCLQLENVPAQSDVAVYDITGKLQWNARGISGMYSHPLPKGIYIISVWTTQFYEKTKVILQ